MKLRFLTIALPLCGCANSPPPPPPAHPSPPHPPYTFVLDGAILRFPTPEEQAAILMLRTPAGPGATTRPTAADLLDWANRRDMLGGRYRELWHAVRTSSN